MVRTSPSFCCLLIFVMCSLGKAAETEKLLSPDKQVEATVHLSADGACLLDVKFHGEAVLVDSLLGLKLSRGSVLGPGTTITSVERRSENITWKPYWGKRAEIVDHFNEMTLTCHSSNNLPPVSIIVRAYDNGVAVRYRLDAEWGEFEINSELTAFHFPAAI